MPWILLGGLSILGILFLSKDTLAGDIVGEKKLFNLPDIDPVDQGGSYKKDFDPIFEKVSLETGVPFALLKSHALMESSLNPRAFRDENPSKRSDRLGWASRGLMQVLFWPGSTRFERFGYTSKDLDGGEKLFDPETNVKVAALLIRENLNACGGNLRDAVNMYNAGVKESVRVAPFQYVDKVLGYYSKLVKREV